MININADAICALRNIVDDVVSGKDDDISFRLRAFDSEYGTSPSGFKEKLNEIDQEFGLGNDYQQVIDKCREILKEMSEL